VHTLHDGDVFCAVLDEARPTPIPTPTTGGHTRDVAVRVEDGGRSATAATTAGAVAAAAGAAISAGCATDGVTRSAGCRARLPARTSAARRAKLGRPGLTGTRLPGGSIGETGGRCARSAEASCQPLSC
jgi:hypothetical protein